MAKIAKNDQPERLALRPPKHVKRAIQEAATLSGVTTSDFVLSCAYPEALRRIERDQRIQLNAR